MSAFRQPPYDWPKLILMLQGAGMRYTRIAALLNLPESSVRNWRDKGVAPNHADGEALVALYMRYFKEEPPRAAAKPSASLLSHIIIGA